MWRFSFVDVARSSALASAEKRNQIPLGLYLLPIVFQPALSHHFLILFQPLAKFSLFDSVTGNQC